MKFEIRSRFTSAVLFTAELETKFETEPVNVQMGAAVKAAYLSGANLRGADLRDADLRDANLRDANLRDANLRGADLSDAYLSGASLSDADLSGAYLSGANLSDAYLRGADLSGAYLSDADLSDAYLRGANLRGAYLSDANLRDANLSDADLRGASLSDADLSGVPEIKDIHKIVYAAATATSESFDMGDWHTCETTHCRAGWVVHLAGAGGAALEFAMGTPAAAALIYLKSDPKLEKIPDFYASNEDALADMKRLAEAA